MANNTAPETEPSNPVEVPLTATGKNKPQTSDHIVAIGGHFMRTVDMYTNRGVLITTGMQRSISTKTRNEYTRVENRMWDSYLSLLEMDSSIETEITKGTKEMRAVIKLLTAGESSARSVDTNGIKVSIPSWFQAPIAIPTVKASRGFNDDCTGVMFTPAGMDFSIPEVRTALQNGTALIDKKPIGGANWRNFLYDGPFNPVLPWVGLLKGRVIVLAYLHVFKSPSSATQTGEGHATKPGNAEIHGMVNVTCSSIAYIATQVLFALSPNATFLRNTPGLELEKHYESLMDYLTNPDHTTEVADLLKWWDKQIFPDVHAPRTDDSNSSVNQLAAARATYSANVAELEGALEDLVPTGQSLIWGSGLTAEMDVDM